MADPTVKRKSGFLMPTYTNDSQLGNTVTVPYYFALSDNYDFTFAPTYTEKAGILLQGQWRHQLPMVPITSISTACSIPRATLRHRPARDFRGSFGLQGQIFLGPLFGLGLGRAR